MQANWPYLEGHFLSACISKGFTHPSLKRYTATRDTQHGMMWEFGVD